MTVGGDGSVATVGWDPYGCGHCVILAHSVGWQTLNAHLQPPDGCGPL